MRPSLRRRGATWPPGAPVRADAVEPRRCGRGRGRTPPASRRRRSRRGAVPRRGRPGRTRPAQSPTDHVVAGDGRAMPPSSLGSAGRCAPEGHVRVGGAVARRGRGAGGAIALAMPTIVRRARGELHVHGAGEVTDAEAVEGGVGRGERVVEPAEAAEDPEHPRTRRRSAGQIAGREADVLHGPAAMAGGRRWPAIVTVPSSGVMRPAA